MLIIYFPKPQAAAAEGGKSCRLPFVSVLVYEFYVLVSFFSSLLFFLTVLLCRVCPHVYPVIRTSCQYPPGLPLLFARSVLSPAFVSIHTFSQRFLLVTYFASCLRFISFLGGALS